MLFDLPLHPLLVHAPVVLLPLTAVGVLILAFTGKRNRAVALSLLALVALACVTTVMAFFSGATLAEVTGVPQAHERWGQLLAIASVVYLLVAGPWLWRVSREGGQAKLWGYGSAVVAVAVTVLAVLAGHSGAEAAWGDKVSTTTETKTPQPVATASETQTSQTPAPTESTTTESASGYTMAQVAEHNTAESCWVAIDRKAYDLTEWIGSHPGGSGSIESMCGTDGTSAFAGKHGGEGGPASALERYLLGPITS